MHETIKFYDYGTVRYGTVETWDKNGLPTVMVHDNGYRLDVVDC